MPIRVTTKGEKPAYQWGTTGAKYVYVSGNKASREAAKRKAIKQGLAVAHRLGVKPEL